MSVTSMLVAIALAAATAVAPASGAIAETSARPCRDAPNTPVTGGAVFNNPVEGDPTAVVRQICSLLHQAPAGARVRIAIFVISGDAGMDFANELIKAHRRGVDIQLVIDGWARNDNPAVHALRDELGTNQSADSWIHACSVPSPEGTTAACIGNKGMHNKFYLFSRTGGASNVLVQSSANFTDLNSTTYWNNAVTIIRSNRVYRAYNEYFEDLAAERRTNDYYRIVTGGSAGGMVRSYFFPRAGTDSSTDTIVEVLDKVGCGRDTNTGPETGGNTTIRIGMSSWDAYRVAIADRLVELAAQGCSVSIVHGPMDSEVRQRLLSGPGIELRELSDADQLPGRIHSKYLLIEGTYDGEKDAAWVFTGSPNFTDTSLRRNDEAMLQTNINAIYDQYRENFVALRAAARPGD